MTGKGHDPKFSVDLSEGRLTLPTTTAIRAITDPGDRIDAATEALVALRALQNLYQGVLDDAATELAEAGATWTEVGSQSEFVDTVRLSRRLVQARRQAYRRGWYDPHRRGLRQAS